ncbi:MAG TPA: caspase family protein [Atribacterota bacterium]|nr:caspase family protein [Atribacterota bacterium]
MHCRILTRKKFLILLIVLIGALSLLSGCGGIIPPPIVNETVYRALCVGVGDYMYFPDIYGNIDLPGTPYDVNRICYTLDRCRFGSADTEFSEIWYNTDWSATKSAILQGITNVFAEADYNDVSYFYFTGHGIRVNNISYLCPTEVNYFLPMSTYISVDELENALSTIPGTKVVILDSCHSGGFIGKGREEVIVSQEELESFNDEVINVFFQAQSKGLLTTNEYKVLTSCHYYQLCWGILPAEGDPFGVFTMGLCKGCGYYGSYPADTNLDTKVSLQEAYLYVKSYVADLDAQLPYINITQDVQVYPNNSSFAIVEY